MEVGLKKEGKGPGLDNLLMTSSIIYFSSWSLRSSGAEWQGGGIATCRKVEVMGFEMSDCVRIDHS